MDKQKKILIFIIVLAFVFRMAPFFILSYPIENDAKQYDDIGWQLASNFSYSRDGIEPTLERPPGYPFFLAFFYFILGHYPSVVTLLQIILSVVAVYIIYLIAELLFANKNISLLAAAATAVYPMFIYYNLFLYSENFAVFSCLLFAYFLFLGFRSDKKIYIFLSGLFFIIFILTKPLFAPILVLIPLFLFINRSIIPLKHSIFLFFLPVVVLWGSWIARNYVVFSKPLPFGIGLGPIAFVGASPSYNAVWPGYEEISRAVPNPGLPAVEYDNLLKQKAIEQARENPEAFVKLFFMKLEKFFVVVQDLSGSAIYKKGAASESMAGIIFPSMFFIYKYFKIIFSAFFIFGAALLVKESIVKINYPAVFLAVISVYSLFAHSLLYVDERYHLPTFPFHIILAFYGIFFVYKKIIALNFWNTNLCQEKF